MAAASEPPLIEIRGLTKRFGSFTAVDNVSFTVARGEVLGFLGPNGAGKSTTMRMLAGFMTPTAGTARICGHDVQADGVAARKALGFLPEGAPTYPDMTVVGFLRFCAGHPRLRRARATPTASNTRSALTTLEAVRLQPVETLSKGFKRRVGLAQALLHDPPVLVLDEPTDGLDPNQKHEVRTLIAPHGAAQRPSSSAPTSSRRSMPSAPAPSSSPTAAWLPTPRPANWKSAHPSGKLDDVFRDLTQPKKAA